MIIIRFPNAESKRRALGYLAGRFPFKSWATGEMMVPEAALAPPAVELEHAGRVPGHVEAREERLEDARQAQRVDAHARIADADLGAAAGQALRRQRYRAAVARELDRVAQELKHAVAQLVLLDGH